MKLLPGVIFSLLISGVTSRPHAGDPKDLTTDNVEKDISKEHINKTLQKLQEISDENGGSRAFGTPGDYQSFRHILNQLHIYGNHGPGGRVLNVTRQPFKMLFEDFRGIKLTGPDGENVEVRSPLYNTATDSREGITAPLINILKIDAHGVVCYESQFDNINVTNKIILFEEINCPLEQGLWEAGRSGAIGALLCQTLSSSNSSQINLSIENARKLIPTGVIDCKVAELWRSRLLKGKELNVALVVDTAFEEKETWNIIAETIEGDPDNVVMLGTHLDSGRERPGISGSGTASAALLEILRSIVQYKGYKNKIRFAWWGAHGYGLAGASYYTSQLTPEQADKIRFYNEFSMTDSSEPGTELLHGKTSVDDIEKSTRYPEYGAPRPSSDREIFSNLGIPLIGLLEGTSALQGQWTTLPTDNYKNDGEPNAAVSCHHPTCDHVNDIDWEAMMAHTKATGRRITQLALSLKRDLPRRTPKCMWRWCHKFLYRFQECDSCLTGAQTCGS